jgi:transcription elongation factor Elf1
MWFVSIDPDEINHDRRTFECPRCQEVTVIVVDISPETA